MQIQLAFLRFRWLAAVAFAAAMPLCANAAVIDVKSSATLRGGLIRLGDIAEIDAVDPILERQLEAVTLGPAPAAGRKLRLTQQTIRERLIAHGVNLTEVEFAGQSVVLIEGPGDAKATSEMASRLIPVRPAAISPAQQKRAERVVQEAFHRQYRPAASDIGPLKLAVEIDDRDVPVLLTVDPETVRFAEQGLVWGGPQTLTVQYPKADGSTNIIRMQAWLNETPHIVTVKHSIQKGKVIKESDLMHVPAKEGQKGYSKAEHLVGQEASRALHPGAPVQSGDVNQVPLVRSNDLVTVKVRSRGFTVSRVLRSSGSGVAGDVINLVSPDNPQEKLQARITGWHEAEIVLPPPGGGPDVPVANRTQGRTFSLTNESDVDLGGP